MSVATDVTSWCPCCCYCCSCYYDSSHFVAHTYTDQHTSTHRECETIYRYLCILCIFHTFM